MIRKLQDTFTIPLTQDQQALVDEKDWRELKQYKWYALWSERIKSYYAVRNIPHPEGGKRKDGKLRQTTERMHRRIMGLEYGDKRQVDHIDHNTLDNRRENLQIVTPRENQENRKNQSKYGVGVFYIKGSKKNPFVAHAHIDGKSKYIGCFATAKEAQQARKEFLRSKTK